MPVSDDKVLIFLSSMCVCNNSFYSAQQVSATRLSGTLMIVQHSLILNTSLKRVINCCSAKTGARGKSTYWLKQESVWGHLSNTLLSISEGWKNEFRSSNLPFYLLGAIPHCLIGQPWIPQLSLIFKFAHQMENSFQWSALELFQKKENIEHFLRSSPLFSKIKKMLTKSK